MNELTPPQVTYLKERGFKVVPGIPNENTSFPYVTLNRLGRFIEEAEIRFHQTAIAHTSTMESYHPINATSKELITMIEKVVAGAMGLEGKLFSTSSGKSIPIYVLDSAWNETAKMLEAKYSC